LWGVGSLLLVLFAAPKVVQLVVQGRAPEQGLTHLRFKEIPAGFTHQSDFVKALPFMALSAIDVDQDGVDEVFVGGGIGQKDGLLRYSNHALVPIDTGEQFAKGANDPTYGAASIDATHDGRVDLFVVRSSGLYFYENTPAGFVGRKVDFPLDKKSMPLSVSFADINHDGWVDLYVSNYIRPEYVEGETVFNKAYGAYSNLLLNNGDNTFTDITRKAGVYEQHNTFNAVFVDLNDDGHSDLVVAQDTGLVRIFKNNGDLTFSRIELPQNPSYPMGIAVSDVNNDGRMDLFFSNVGNTLPAFMLRGDLRDNQVLNQDYILLENQGNFVFKDVARAKNAANYGFGWGLVSYDFNNDTRADYLVTQNYIRFPGVQFLDLYAGNLLQQSPDGRFAPVESVAGIENKKFGVTAVVSDFNADGWPDVVFANLSSPVRAFINQGGANHWLKVSLRDDPHSLGARLRLTLADGTVYTNQYFSSQGLGSDQTSAVFFGLGEHDQLKQLEVIFQGGKRLLLPAPKLDSLLDLRNSNP